MRRLNRYLEAWFRGDINFPRCWEIPVVKITNELNPFATDEVELYAVLGCALPYESMKALAALGLLLDGWEKGLFIPGETSIAEGTSGATGLALTQFALSEPFNARSVNLFMNDDVPLQKRMAPKFAGAKIDGPYEKMDTIETARMKGQEPGWWNPGQYDNQANASLYASWAAPQISAAIPGLTVLACPLGTGGTILGLSQGFKNLGLKITKLGGMCSPKAEIPGMRDRDGLNKVRLSWQSVVPEENRLEVQSAPAYLAAAWFHWIHSEMVGLSSGAAYITALMGLKMYQDARMFDVLRADDGVVRVAIICHDGARPYLVDRFPMIHHDDQDPVSARKPWELLW